jgi:hypothetical protein
MQEQAARPRRLDSFLNKVDLLIKKLESGIHLNKYLTQYKGSNTVTEICKCE